MFLFDMPMTWRESVFLLFGKKRCPACATPLARMTKTHDEGSDWHGGEYEHTTRIEFEYECRRCRKWYSLAELAARRR